MLTLKLGSMLQQRPNVLKLHSKQLPSEVNSTTASKLYPPPKPIRNHLIHYQTFLATLLTIYRLQESTSSLFVPHHRYYPRNIPTRRLSTDISTIILFLIFQATLHYGLKNNLYLLMHILPNLTSGLVFASLLSSGVQTAYLSGNLFSKVLIPNPVPAHVQLPEDYTAEHSRPPTPFSAVYPIQVHLITIYDTKTIHDSQPLQNASLQ